MFLAYINGLVGILEQHNIKVKLFADDLEIYITIVDDTDVLRCPRCTCSVFGHLATANLY